MVPLRGQLTAQFRDGFGRFLLAMVKCVDGLRADQVAARGDAMVEPQHPVLGPAGTQPHRMAAAARRLKLSVGCQEAAASVTGEPVDADQHADNVLLAALGATGLGAVVARWRSP